MKLRRPARTLWQAAMPMEIMIVDSQINATAGATTVARAAMLPLGTRVITYSTKRVLRKLTPPNVR